MGFGSKAFILTAAIMVVLGCTIGGTIAWMFTKSEPVTNTFEYRDMVFELVLSESLIGEEEQKYVNRYSLQPGKDIAKDPYITIGFDTVDCWVFVKVDESENLDTFIEYEIAEGWKHLKDNIYYRYVKGSEEAQGFNILKGNKVSVKDSVTQDMLDALEETEYPTLSFTGYVIQYFEGDTIEDAWHMAEIL